MNGNRRTTRLEQVSSSTSGRRPSKGFSSRQQSPFQSTNSLKGSNRRSFGRNGILAFPLNLTRFQRIELVHLADEEQHLRQVIQPEVMRLLPLPVLIFVVQMYRNTRKLDGLPVFLNPIRKSGNLDGSCLKCFFWSCHMYHRLIESEGDI